MKTNYSVIPRMMANHPRMSLHILESLLRVGKTQLWDYNFKGGKSSELPLVTLKITPHCNLQCVMCGQRGETGIMKDRAVVDREAESMVPLDVYKKLTDELAGTTKIFYVWGGEPLLYPDFMDLAAYMAKKIPGFCINTNGTLLKQHARRIVEDQWPAMFVSLDSFEEINDSIRGEGSYRKAIEGIQEIEKEKKRQKATLPYVGIVTTVSNLNYTYLHDFVRAVSNLDLSWHIINLGTYLDEELGARHQAVIQEKLGYTPTYWKGFTSGYNRGIDGNLFSEELKKVHAIPVKHPIITVPVIDPGHIGSYYADMNFLARKKCAAPWFSVDIDYNGNVNFCADYHDYSIGNIKEKPLLEIYNSAMAVKFRNALKDSPDGLFPACRRCYQLMLGGKRVK